MKSDARGKDETQPHRQRYQYKSCSFHSDDSSDTINACHHQPLRVWILCLYFMGLNLSNEQIAQELDLNHRGISQEKLPLPKWIDLTEELAGHQPD